MPYHPRSLPTLAKPRHTPILAPTQASTRCSSRLIFDWKSSRENRDWTVLPRRRKNYFLFLRGWKGKTFSLKKKKKEILGWDFRASKVRDLVDRSDCEESKCRKLLEQNTLSLSSRSRSPTKQKVFRQRAEARKKLCELKLLVSFPIFFGEERESEQKRETMQQEKADYRGETFAFREKKCASLDCIRNERSAPLAA